ncbi:hypothetical protein OROMI_012743 [Orobanche minor]
MRFKKQSPIPYVHAYYSIDKWRQIYASEVMPVPDPSDWQPTLNQGLSAKL